MVLKLIVIYAAYGDALLLQTPDQPPKYWLIDGGPIQPAPSITLSNHRISLNAYYQYLIRALHRYCSSQKNGIIDNLSGIIVTHPDGDHMDGINRLLRNDIAIPANFRGPILLNSTFFRPDPEHFEYPLVQYLDQFNHPQFGLSEIPDPLQVSQPDLQIPANMKNGSLAGLFKMSYGATRNPYPEPTNFEWEKRDLDKSRQNWSSIMTLWLEPGIGGRNQLSLATTGDGLPSYILQRMQRATPQDLIPAVGIFKVPHHGSEYNNQWAEDDRDYVSPGSSEQEKTSFFVLTMLALRYSELSPQNRPSLTNLAAIALFRARILRGGPMLDWTARYGLSAAEFQESILQVSLSFHTYLERYPTSATIDGKRFELKDTLPLQQFADALLVRYNDRTTQILRDGRVAGSSDVSFRFSVEVFKVMFLKTFPTKQFESIFNCLDNNSLNDLRKAKLVQNFYSKFTAKNYVISANHFPHDHPKASVLAGLMSYLILTVRPGDGSRIFLTDGASFPVDYVYDLIIALLPDTIGPRQWNQKVRVYYLSTDFLAEIPVDLANVDGVKEIDFAAYVTATNENYLAFLHDQFMQAKPYDMPRAAISQTSMFRITVRSAQDPVARYIDMDANGRLLLASGTQPPLFNLRYIDHTAANLSRWMKNTEPHFYLFTDQAQNFPIGNLVFSQINNTGLSPDAHVYQDAGSQLLLLHFDKGVFSFIPGLGPTLAIVQTQRNS